MSFLLGRSSTSFMRSPLSLSTAHSSPLASSSSVLYDAEDRSGSHDGEGDDELEAAFGDAHDDADEALPRADGEDLVRLEEAQLLGPGAQDNNGYGSRPGMERTNSTTTLGNVSLHTNPNPGGYDFEADPYERSRPTLTRPLTQRTGLGRRRSNSSRRRSGRDVPAGGILATLQNALPARWRRYGLLNNGGGTSLSGRRLDGTADHGDGDDEEDDDWDAPPPSMPGLYGGGTNNDGVFSNLMAKPGGRIGNRGGQEIVGGDDEAREKEIPPVMQLKSCLTSQLTCPVFRLTKWPSSILHPLTSIQRSMRHLGAEAIFQPLGAPPPVVELTTSSSRACLWGIFSPFSGRCWSPCLSSL